jgi:anti-sigma regulatory factor (Ser/Thr protein kinase)
MIPLPVFGALTALAPEYIWLMFPLSEIICAAIWRTVLWMSAGTARRENRYDPRRIFSRTITGAARDVGELVSGVKEFCGRWSGDERKTYNTMAVTEEIAAVIIGNAFRNNHDEYISISLIAMEDGGFHLHVRDNANFFNPLAIRAHKIQDDSGDDLSGVEMFIIKNLAEKLFYRRYRGFNTLVIYI